MWRAACQVQMLTVQMLSVGPARLLASSLDPDCSFEFAEITTSILSCKHELPLPRAALK
jgi:hypothetical protein